MTDGKRVEVRAAMSGVFYRKPSPDEPAYVEVGDTVKKKANTGIAGDHEGLSKGEISGRRKNRGDTRAK